MITWVWLLALGCLLSLPYVLPAYAQNCAELNNCPTDMNPLDWITMAWELQIGEFAVPLIWAVVIVLTYIKFENAMFATVLGLMIFTGIVTYNPEIFTNSNTGILFYWAIMIVAVAFGCTLYYLLKVKVHTP